MIEKVLLISSLVNTLLLLVILKMKYTDRTPEVIAAIKKAREWNLKATLGMRSHVTTALDTLVPQSESQNRMLIWLKGWAERMGK
jgi:hypothetical protein